MKGVEKKEKRVDYVVNVLRAKDLTEKSNLDTNVAFDMEVNGIKIYGCWLKEGTGKDGNYYNVAWFPISEELTKEIREQIVKIL